jgi:chromosome segregation ATPase
VNKKPPATIEETPARASIDTPEALAQRLTAALGELGAQQEALRERIAEHDRVLAAIPGKIASVEQEADRAAADLTTLPAQITSARVALMGVAGTSAEVSAQARLAELQGLLEHRRAALPAIQTEAAQKVQALQAEQETLQAQQAKDRTTLAELETLAAEVRQQRDQAQWAAEQARRARLREERAALLAEVDQAEAQARAQRERLAAFDAALPLEMQLPAPSATAQALDAFIALCQEYERLAGQIHHWMPQGVPLAALLEIPASQVQSCLSQKNTFHIADRRRRAEDLRSAV